MWTSFLLLAVILLLSYLLLLPIIRAYSRTRADNIIKGKRSATEKQITKCIRVLTWSNKWFTNNEEQDSQRIERLLDMLEEMQHPHG